MNPFINKNENTNQNSNDTSGKGVQFAIGAKQSHFIFNVSAIAGLAFLIVLGLGYLFKYLIVDLGNVWFASNLIYMMAGSSIVCIVISLFYSFSKKASIGLLAFMYIVFILMFSFAISTIFIYFEMNELMFIFGITGGTLLITGIVGYLMSDKFAFTLSKIFMILFGIYFIAFFAYLMIAMFSGIGTAINWYSYLITGLVGVIILISNCLEFYRLKKISSFINMTEMKQEDIIKLTVQTSLTLLMSVIQTLMLVARLYLLSEH